VKRLLLLTTSLALVLPAAAIAQDHRPPQHGQSGHRPPAHKPPAHRPPAHKPPVARPPAHRPPAARPPAHRPPAARPPAHRPPVARPPAHRPGAGRPPHFRPVHRPAFRYPHGYAYRRWNIGVFLPSLFLSSNYYYDDWAPLGVGAPPYGYRWVRYGPDLLLVNIRTRRIADVIYGAFY
jgi:Ni/Co efflux regulator RcnB